MAWRRGTESCAGPIIDDVHIDFHTVQFNGTFTHENIYRQDPAPEVDAAWEDIGISCESTKQMGPTSGLTLQSRTISSAG
jgi:ethanolamine ammonia-lyase large subunit